LTQNFQPFTQNCWTKKIHGFTKPKHKTHSVSNKYFIKKHFSDDESVRKEFADSINVYEQSLKRIKKKSRGTKIQILTENTHSTAARISDEERKSFSSLSQDSKFYIS